MRANKKLKDKAVTEQGNAEELQQKKWHQKTWVRVVALLLVLTLISSEIIYKYISAPKRITGLQPQILLDEEVREVLEDPIQLLEDMRKIQYLNKEAQRKLMEASEKAEKYIAEGKYEEAIEPVEYIMENMDLDESDLWQMKATRTALYFAAGDFEEARNGCTEIIEAGEDAEGYHYFMRSVCDFQEEKFESSKTDLMNALEAGYEDQSLCYVHLAFCENFLEDYVKVLEYSKQALELGADEVYHMTLVYLQAVASLKLEKFDESIKYIDLLLAEEEYQKDGQLYYYRGVCHLTNEDYQKAYDDFEESFACGEDTTLLYYNRGVASLGLNDIENAKKDMEVVVERGDEAELKTAAEEILSLIGQ